MELKVLLLSYIVYSNADECWESSQASKTKISSKTVESLQSFTVFTKSSILNIRPDS